MSSNEKLLREKAKIRMRKIRAQKALELEAKELAPRGLEAKELGAGGLSSRELEAVGLEAGNFVPGTLASGELAPAELAPAEPARLEDKELLAVPKRHLIKSTSGFLIFETLPPSSPPPPDRTHEEVEESFRLTEMRNNIGDWACEWGHPLVWAQRLRDGYKEAASISEGAVAKWVTHVTLHAYTGCHYMQSLKAITDDDIPKHDWQIQELWRNTLDLLDPLYKGIAIIEAQVDLIRVTPRSRRGL